MYRPSPWLRLGLMALVLGGIVASAVIETRDPSWILARLEDAGPLLPLAFMAVHVIASLTFVPRSVMAFVAGALWSFWFACLWSQLGSAAGALAGFLLARYVNAGLLVPEEMARLGPLLQRAEAGGWRSVMVVRLIPVLPHALTNYALGLTRVSVRDYLVGSSLGLVPHTLAFVSLGMSGRRALEGGAWLEPMLWGFAFLALSILLPKFLRRSTP